MNGYELFKIGEKLLFLPVIIFIALVAIGLALFLIVTVSSIIISAPIKLFNKSLESGEEKLKKNAKTDYQKKLSLKEVWIITKSGSWLVWLASLPLLLYILLVIIYASDFLYSHF